MEKDTVVPMLEKSIGKFLGWLDRNGYESYDPYDIWGIPYSLWARRLYYKNSLLGVPFIAPIILIDTFVPSLRKLLVKKERFATADAQLILAFLNLYNYYKDKYYLEKATALGRELLEYSIPGYSGYCWGYPFDWQNSAALWKRNTPYITATPYCFEAYLGLYDETGNNEYLNIAESIAHFVAYDLKETSTGPDAAAGSYSPIDNSKVINASAYRAMVLTEAAERFGEKEYQKKADKNINFILNAQNDNGSWLYELDHPKGAFIDHFHTCFVLKNLVKINRHLNNATITEVIQKGFSYYRSALFEENGRPKPFAVQPRIQIVVEDLYNYAEAITLCSIMEKIIPGSVECAEKLAGIVRRDFQLKSGYFVTKVYMSGIKTKISFIRWSQAQLFYALTNLLCIENRN